MQNGQVYTVKNFDHLIGDVRGMSEKQLRAHFELYQGYVKKANEIEERLNSVGPQTANYSFGEISELLRRLPVAHNGAYLHELFFENLTGKKTEPSPELVQAVEMSFGTWNDWLAHTKAGLLSSPGWVLMVRSKRDGKIRNNLVEEHHRGVFVDQDILLALDGWEHAYMIDYGIKKADFFQTLVENVDWSIVNRRFQSAQMVKKVAA